MNIQMFEPRVHIGSRYTGLRQGQADFTTGEYWEAMAPIEGDALMLQKMLLGASLSPRHVDQLRAERRAAKAFSESQPAALEEMAIGDDGLECKHVWTDDDDNSFCRSCGKRAQGSGQ